MPSTMGRLLAAVWLCLTCLGASAAEFAVTDTAGQVHRLSDYRGKWLLVNYWATWCPPCLEEVPDLVNLYDQRKDKDLAVIGVAFEYRSAAEVAAYVDDMLMSYPIVLGNGQVTAAIGPADVLPTTYVYDPQGKLKERHRGLITREYIEKLMAGARTPASPAP